MSLLAALKPGAKRTLTGSAVFEASGDVLGEPYCLDAYNAAPL